MKPEGQTRKKRIDPKLAAADWSVAPFAVGEDRCERKHRTKHQFLFDTALLLFVIAVSSLYLLINEPTTRLHVLHISLDRDIPRIPAFAVPYIAFLPIFWLTLLLAWLRGKEFRRLALVVVVVQLAAFCVYLLYQSYVPRSPVIGTDVFSILLRWIYSSDQPYNAFPSLHSALAVVMALYYISVRSKWRWLFVAYAVLVVASTLLVKQHYVVDAVSGVLLGSVTAAAFMRFGSRRLC